VEVGGAGASVTGERDGARKDRIGGIGIGRAAGDRVVPPAPAGIVEQDALEAMVVADRPAALGSKGGQGDAGEVEPFGFQLGARRGRDFPDQGRSIAARIASTSTVQKPA
jgi:hypothetical protein